MAYWQNLNKNLPNNKQTCKTARYSHTIMDPWIQNYRADDGSIK